MNKKIKLNVFLVLTMIILFLVVIGAINILGIIIGIIYSKLYQNTNNEKIVYIKNSIIKWFKEKFKK